MNNSRGMKQGRVYGILAIVFLAVAAISALITSVLPSSTIVGHLRFLFFAAGAFLAFWGYYKVDAIGTGHGVIVILTIAIPMFLIFMTGTTGNALWVISAFVLHTGIPIALSFFALKEKNVVLWKRLVPLLIPVFIDYIDRFTCECFAWMDNFGNCSAYGQKIGGDGVAKFIERILPEFRGVFAKTGITFVLFYDWRFFFRLPMDEMFLRSSKTTAEGLKISSKH